MHIKDLPLEARGIITSRLYFALLKQGKTETQAEKIYHNCHLWTIAQVQLYIDISDVLKGVNYAPKYTSR